MINIETKNDKFTAFGGLAYIFNAFSKSGLPKLIENSLGKRGVRCTSCSYASILRALIAVS